MANEKWRFSGQTSALDTHVFQTPFTNYSLKQAVDLPLVLNHFIAMIIIYPSQAQQNKIN
jgi:hypothetical protein